MRQELRYLLIFILQLHSVMTARILGVFVHPGRSNSLYTHAVMDIIATAGHDVTVYSHFKPSSSSSFHHVYIPLEYHDLTYEDFMKLFFGAGFGGSLLRSITHFKSEKFLNNHLVQQLLYSNETFDLVFTGASFAEESMLVFGHVFKAPTITLLPSGTWSPIDYITGNSLSLAYAPEYLAYPFTDRMSLIERIKNVLSGTVSLLWYHWYDLPGHDDILQRLASSISPPPPPVHQMARDVALTFVNVHPSISYPKPLPPNIVMIGGVHIKPNGRTLPKEIQQLMDNAEEGVIFCSLGSIIPVDTMPLHILQAFINAFRRFPQQVIWKISNETLLDFPDNVFASSWLPQQQIIKHPNLKLFFTHGGLGSQLEALRVGVPVVGLPFISDQPYNVRFYEQLGVGVGLSPDNLSEEAITAAMQTVLNNSSYAENARRMARLYADRPMDPKALVIYWTEYVLRHGAAHLRPQAATMPWYQRGLLDVASVLLLGVIITMAIVTKVFLILYRKILFTFWYVKVKEA